MPGPNPNSDSFAAVLGKAQQTPDVATETGRDLPDGFPLPMAAHHRVVDSAKDPAGIEGMVAYDFTCRRGVFLIFRPYEHCNRCADAMAADPMLLPTVGDYTCPHTQLAEYEAVLNRTLAGEFLFGSENEVIQKDGSIVISVKWFEKKLSPKKKKRAHPADGPKMQQDEPDA